jgi:ParB family chromosome partitioning protein
MSRLKGPSSERLKMKNVGLFTNDEETTNPTTVPLAKIVLPQYQPRRYFDPEAMQSLIESVQQEGILQPILVRPLAGKYELIAGERRYRAAQQIGLTDLPAVVRDLSDEQAKQCTLIENLQREDLNPLEETEGILAFLQLKLERDREEVISLLNQLANYKRGITDNVVREADQQIIEGIFSQLGRFSVESFRTHRLPLLKLPAEIQEALLVGQIQYTKAREIAKIKDPSARQELLAVAIEDGLSIKQIRQRIKELQSPKQSETDGLANQLSQTYQKVRKSKQLWQDSKKRKKLESLLSQIEQLISEERDH